MPRHDRFATSFIGLLSILGVRCLSPDYSKITVLCPAESPACPPEMVCVSGICQVMSAGDGTNNSPADFGADFGATDMQIVSLCPNGRDEPIGQARGCPGTFTKGKASSQCPLGWSLCQDLSKVDLTLCGTVKSFYASSISGYWSGTMTLETCGGGISNQLFYGCGVLGRLSTIKCGGFPRVIDLVGPWSATDGTISSASLTDSAQGVLCCPP